MSTRTFYRGRRLRRTETLREMIREHSLLPQYLIMPYFVVDTPDSGLEQPIGSMPGQSQLSLAKLEETVARAVDSGLKSCLLFGIPAAKDTTGSEAWAENGIVQRAVARLKSRFPELVVITDVCLCEYTSHGHCGLLDPQGQVRNDETVAILAKTALSHARAGADIVAPSDMMDGRVLAIREALDSAGFAQIPVMSYASKFASTFYGPFREAAESAPSFGNRKSYQMDPANGREAMREAMADLQEGADMLIVKPAGHYLDILAEIRRRCDVPLTVYQVSGEYAMIKAAGERGWIDETGVVLETLTAFKRAGADLIISYFTQDLLCRGIIK